MFATEPTHHIRELAHRVPGKISRSFTFKVNAEFSCDSNGEVVYLMDERDLELTARCCRPDANYCAEYHRVRVCESRVLRAFLHQVNRLVYDTPRCFRVSET